MEQRNCHSEPVRTLAWEFVLLTFQGEYGFDALYFPYSWKVGPIFALKVRISFIYFAGVVPVFSLKILMK